MVERRLRGPVTQPEVQGTGMVNNCPMIPVALRKILCASLALRIKDYMLRGVAEKGRYRV